jgi:hypothetical protein
MDGKYSTILLMFTLHKISIQQRCTTIHSDYQEWLEHNFKARAGNQYLH